MSNLLIPIVMLGLVGFSQPLAAAILAFDDFEGYTSGSQLESGTGVQLNGGTGFTGAYNVEDAFRANAVIATKSLSYAPLGMSGGSQAAMFGGDISLANSFLARQFSSQSGTVYLSFLFNGAQTSEDEDFFQFGFSDVSTNEPPISMGISGTAANTLPNQFFLRAPTMTANTTFLSSPTFSLDTTYLLVLKISKVSGSLTYNRFDFFLNPTTLTEPSPTLTRTVSTSLSSVDFFRGRVARINSGDTYYLDQLNISTTFADAVPEPSSGLLLGAALVGFSFRRSRQGKPGLRF